MGIKRLRALQGQGVEHVAMYLRVSTEEQARSGLGIQAQREKCTAMATVKGWPPPEEYLDDGISGTVELRKRDGMRDLLAAVKAGRVDAIIVNDISRVARTARLVLQAVDEMTEAGALFVFCKEAIDLTSPYGTFGLTIFAALAELERNLIAERTSAALQVLSRRTGYTGGRVPYGYALAPDNRIVIDQEAAAIVRRIFLLKLKGQTLRAIADHLNQRGLLPPRGGETWRHTSVADILSRASSYAGGPRGQSDLRWPVIYKYPRGAAADVNIIPTLGD